MQQYVSPRAEDNISIAGALLVASFLAKGGLNDFLFSVRAPLTQPYPGIAEKMTLRDAVKAGFATDVPIHIVAESISAPDGEHNVAALNQQIERTPNRALGLLRAWQLLYPTLEASELNARIFASLIAQPAVLSKISEALE